MKLWPISKPAACQMKPKPVRIERASRLPTRFVARKAMVPASTASTITCVARARKDGSFQPLARRVGAIATALISARRHGVHLPALCPERVGTALHAQSRPGADITFEDLAVIADPLDRAIGPTRVEAESLAHIAGDAEQALDLRVRALLHLVDIGG